MKPLKLDTPLVLEERQDVADGAGGFVKDWIAKGTLWACLDARGGREVKLGDTTVSKAVFRITVRAARVGAPSRPKADQRFRSGSRMFRILAVADEGLRYLTCFAEEEVAS